MRDFFDLSMLKETLTTLIGVLIAFVLAYRYDLRKKKIRLQNQLKSIHEEMKVNNETIKNIKKGWPTGFTVDRLEISAIETLLANPDFYSKDHKEIIEIFLAYKKFIFISNQVINFCYENWVQGKWENDETLKKNNINALEEKFLGLEKSINIMSHKLSEELINAMIFN